MAFSAMVRKMMVSAPGDVQDRDWEIVVDTVLRWNLQYGPNFNASVAPMRWKEHAAAVHGVHPQAAINKQLVEDCDGVLALFWHRLGTPTDTAESGTIEELEFALDLGRTVAILHCSRTLPADVDTAQLDKLRDFFEANRERSLILTYDDERSLSQHVDTFLTRMVTSDQVSAEASAQKSAKTSADVWARIDTQDRQKPDSKGRIKHNRRWEIVLYNSGEAAAKNVRFRMEKEKPENDSALPTIMSDGRVLEVLAPKGEARWVIAMHMAVVDQARCIINWDEDGEERENIVTLRFF